MTTNAPATGRCNCGAVTLTLEDGFPDSTVRPLSLLSHQPRALELTSDALYNCTNCRRSSGSLFSAIMFVPPHAVSTAGEEHVKQYADKHTDSGGTLLRHFCGFCGSSLYSMVQGVPESLVVRAGLFEPHTLPPLSVEVFTRNLERFERVHPGVVSFEGMPPQPTSSASEAVQARM